MTQLSSTAVLWECCRPQRLTRTSSTALCWATAKRPCDSTSLRTRASWRRSRRSRSGAATAGDERGCTHEITTKPSVKAETIAASFNCVVNEGCVLFRNGQNNVLLCAFHQRAKPSTERHLQPAAAACPSLMLCYHNLLSRAQGSRSCTSPRQQRPAARRWSTFEHRSTSLQGPSPLQARQQPRSPTARKG